MRTDIVTRKAIKSLDRHASRKAADRMFDTRLTLDPDISLEDGTKLVRAVEDRETAKNPHRLTRKHVKALRVTERRAALVEATLEAIAAIGPAPEPYVEPRKPKRRKVRRKASQAVAPVTAGMPHLESWTSAADYADDLGQRFFRADEYLEAADYGDYGDTDVDVDIDTESEAVIDRRKFRRLDVNCREDALMDLYAAGCHKTNRP